MTTPGIELLERRLEGGALRFIRASVRGLHKVSPARGHQHEAGGDPLFVSTVRERADSAPAETLQALRQALAGGALESARVLCERIPLTGDVETLELLLQTLLAYGERDEASKLAGASRAALSTTDRGATLLELLGLGSESLTLPSGRLNALGIERQLKQGSLSASALAEQLRGRLRVWLREPEAHLLLSNALRVDDPQAACRFFGRYLQWHGLAGCTQWPKPIGVSPLATLTFQPRPRAAGGPLVSVILAAHDAEATLGYAIDSLLAQTHQRLEILIGDDASRDGTSELLHRYGDEPRVRLFRSEANQGAYNVRNALIRRARGELVTFHDADDLALPTRIQTQVALLSSQGAQACVANRLRVDPEGRFVFFKDQKASRLALVSLMLRRGALDAVGPLRPVRFGGDLELYADVRAKFGAGAVVRSRAPLIVGLWAPTSVTGSVGSESLPDGFRSPARRRYSELVYFKHGPATTRPSEEDIGVMLQETGNWASARPLIDMKP